MSSNMQMFVSCFQHITLWTWYKTCFPLITYFLVAKCYAIVSMIDIRSYFMGLLPTLKGTNLWNEILIKISWIENAKQLKNLCKSPKVDQLWYLKKQKPTMPPWSKSLLCPKHPSFHLYIPTLILTEFLSFARFRNLKNWEEQV